GIPPGAGPTPTSPRPAGRPSCRIGSRSSSDRCGTRLLDGRRTRGIRLFVAPTASSTQPTASGGVPSVSPPDPVPMTSAGPAGGPPPPPPPRRPRTPPPPPPPEPEPAPGLGDQFGATRDSAKRLLGAHVELAKAEIDEISGAVKRAGTFGGVALGFAVVAAL